MMDELSWEKREAKNLDYRRYLAEENEEVEFVTCEGDMCTNYVEEDDDKLCLECQRLMQKCFSEWLSDFNEHEREYIIQYIKEREV